MFSGIRARRGAPLRSVLVVLLALCSAAPLVGSAEAAAQPRKQKVALTLAVGPQTVLRGDSVRVAGRARPARAGAPVRVEVRRPGRWVTVRRSRLGTGSRYLLRFVPPTGRHRYRVVVSGSRRHYAGVSRVFGVDAQTCTPMASPSEPTQVWFSDPRRSRVSEISRRLGRLFCAAAPGARVNIAMYFIRAGDPGTDVSAILAPLERMVRLRDLRVRILLEAKVYRRTSPLFPTLRVLRRFATVVLCDWGCRSDKTVGDPGSPGIMHHKFVTISDMAWRRGADPVVVSSSANWSRSQLAGHWQSAVMTYRDAQLYAEFTRQGNALVGCARAGDCGSWAQRDGASRAGYGFELVNGIWYEDPARLRAGDPGRGSAAAFSPWGGDDPLVTDLRSYGCSPQHGTVRVAHMFITRGRHRVLEALKGLRQLGCDVDVVLSSSGSELSLEGIELARAAGLEVTCTAHMHDKLLLVDALDAEGRPAQVVWAGSQSLGGNALRRNEEALLRLSVADATGEARQAAGRVFGRYGEYWQVMRRTPAPCGSGAEHELSRMAAMVTGEPAGQVLPQ